MLTLTLVFMAMLGIASLARQTDDGQAVLITDLLAQPFRIAKLEKPSGLKGSPATTLGLNDVALSLAVSPQFPDTYTGEVHTHPQYKTSEYTSLRVFVTVGKYSAAELLKAKKASREDIKSAAHVRKTKLGQLHDTSFTITVAGHKSSSVQQQTLLTLSTLDPYLPNSKAILGARAGIASQAVRFESTGHSETEGLMVANSCWWKSLLGEEKAGGKSSSSDGSDIYGTFTLTFVNRQEFVLTLRDVSSTEAAVTFYGFATPPVTAASSTLASQLATFFGIGSGNFIEALFDLPQGSVEGGVASRYTIPRNAEEEVSLVHQYMVSAIQVLLTPLKWLVGDITTDAGEDSARALVQTVASVAGWVTSSWPLLLAAAAVFTIKIMADVLNNRKEQKQMIVDMNERRRVAKEAEAKISELLAKAGEFNKKNAKAGNNSKK